MREAKALDPLPDALASVLRDVIKLSKLIDAQARSWLETQDDGPDKRRLASTLGATSRDMLLLEQYLVRDLSR